jgi:ribosome biogenesis protein Tsr3
MFPKYAHLIANEGGRTVVTKEMIKSEIEKVPDDRLEELYGVVKTYTASQMMSEEERARKMDAVAESVFERRKSVFEELAKGAERHLAFLFLCLDVQTYSGVYSSYESGRFIALKQIGVDRYVPV